MTSQSAVNDRFHNALYAVLLRPGLSTSSTLPMLFGLLFQALSADVSTRRIAAFIKRMLQFAASAPANVTCGVLVVVSEVLKKKPALWGSILQPEDEGVEQFQDAEEPATDADAPVAADSDRQELPAKSSLSSSDTQNARSGILPIHASSTLQCAAPLLRDLITLWCALCRRCSLNREAVAAG